ncbi:MAG: beta-propeller fold lactonase family protein, partial [Limisphaerales bacterium]
LAPPNKLQRFEGVAFSPSGDVLSVATADTKTVYLFRRNANGLLEDTPYCDIGGPESGLSYPHDVAFTRWGDTELLAVGQRGGAIALYEKNQANGNYGPEPAFEIRGSKTKLDYSDGVAFVPPHDEYIAACNLEHCSITFYRRDMGSAVGFELEPALEIDHLSLVHPDGLAFSPCGRWLAVANHGNHTVSIFQGRKRNNPGEKLEYGPAPVTIIEDPGLRHPHSVAFTPETYHLVVTPAGANYFCVYEPARHKYGLQWSQSPVLQITFGPDDIFKEVNVNTQEGGPKGIAIHSSSLAICSPESGVKIYSFHERV